MASTTSFNSHHHYATVDLQSLGQHTIKEILLQLNYICKRRHHLLSQLLTSFNCFPEITNDEYALKFTHYHHELLTCIQTCQVDQLTTATNVSYQPSPPSLQFHAIRSLYPTLFKEYVTHSSMINTLLVAEIQAHYEDVFSKYPLSRCQVLGLQDPIRKYPHVASQLSHGLPPEEPGITDGLYVSRPQRDTTTELVYGEITLLAIAQIMWSEAVNIHNILHNIYYQHYLANSLHLVPTPLIKRKRSDSDFDMSSARWNHTSSSDDDGDDDGDDNDDDEKEVQDSSEDDNACSRDKADCDTHDGYEPLSLQSSIEKKIHLPQLGVAEHPVLPKPIDFEHGNDLFVESDSTIWLDTAELPQSDLHHIAVLAENTKVPKFPKGMRFTNANIRKYIDSSTSRNFHHTPETIDPTKQHMRSPQHVFMDLGGGVAKLTIYMSFLTNAFTDACSIEVLPTMHNLACEFAEPIEFYRKMDRQPPATMHDSSIHIINGSFFDLDWSFADLVIATSTCFPAEMFCQLSYRARNLRSGSIFVTLSDPLEHPSLDLLYSLTLPMTWGPALVYFHIRK